MEQNSERKNENAIRDPEQVRRVLSRTVLRFSLFLLRHLVDAGHRSDGPFGKKNGKKNHPSSLDLKPSRDDALSRPLRLSQVSIMRALDDIQEQKGERQIPNNCLLGRNQSQYKRKEANKRVCIRLSISFTFLREILKNLVLVRFTMLGKRSNNCSIFNIRGNSSTASHRQMTQDWKIWRID